MLFSRSKDAPVCYRVVGVMISRRTTVTNSILLRGSAVASYSSLTLYAARNLLLLDAAQDLPAAKLAETIKGLRRLYAAPKF